MLRDLGFAYRLLVKRRGFTAAVVVTLALGIGANTAVYSVIDAVLLRPAPIDMERLVMVWQTDRASGTAREPASVPDFLDVRSRTTTLDAVAALRAGEVNLTRTGADPEHVAILQVTHDIFEVLGVSPVAGRVFSADEDWPGGAAVAVISASFGRRLFERAEAAIGQTLSLDDKSVTIVGVVPDATDFGVLQILSAAAYGRSFADRDGASRVGIWLPLAPNPETLPRSTHPIFQLARIATAASVEAARAEMNALATDLERTYPQSNRNRGMNVERLSDVVFGPARPILALLAAAVIAVLLIACVNVANLLLAQGAARTQEVAVRAAVGASIARLFRQFLTESVTLTVLGALVGIAAGAVGVRAFLSLAPADIPRLGLISLDGSVLGAALLVTGAVAVTFGIVPTLQARRVDLARTLKDEGARTTGNRRQVRLRRGLVVIELATAVTLLAGSGLLIRSFWNLQRVETGFHADGVLKAQYQLPSSRYPAPFASFPNFPRHVAFSNELLARVAALPGVSHAAIAGNHPLDPGFTNSIRVVGREAEGADWPEISIRRVSDNYFSTMRLGLVQGRLLGREDGSSAPAVAVINETAARRFFANRDPIGSEVSFWGIRRRVVGVVANERFQGLAGPTPLGIYVPLAQLPANEGVLLVRTPGDPSLLARSVREAIRSQDPLLAIFGVEALNETLSRTVSERRFAMLLVTTFAAIAVLLAAIGVYGVLDYDVTLRTREIGVRLALGAQPAAILRLVVGQALVLVGLALAIGVAGAVSGGRLLSALLFGIGASDPVTIGAVALLLGVVALMASALPARRAARTEPSVALRE